jgi:hypothetical protein
MSKLTLEQIEQIADDARDARGNGRMIRVTAHAIERFIERVVPCSFDEAREAILSHARAIEKAAEIKCAIVKLGDGSRLVLDGTTVLTVYARHDLLRQCRNPHRQEAA